MRISHSLIVVASTALLLTACGSSVTAPETSTSSAAKAGRDHIQLRSGTEL